MTTPDSVPPFVQNMQDPDDEPTEVEIIPEEVQERVRRLVQIEIQEHYSGPLPHPRMLREYNEIVPGTADRILGMAERQEAHRQALETAVVGGGAKRSRLGLILGFVISMTIVGCGTFLVSDGHGTAGIILISVDLATLAGVFVYGRRDQRQERIEKQQLTA